MNESSKHDKLVSQLFNENAQLAVSLESSEQTRRGYEKELTAVREKHAAMLDLLKKTLLVSVDKKWVCKIYSFTVSWNLNFCTAFGILFEMKHLDFYLKCSLVNRTLIHFQFYLSVLFLGSDVNNLLQQNECTRYREPINSNYWILLSEKSIYGSMWE